MVSNRFRSQLWFIGTTLEVRLQGNRLSGTIPATLAYLQLEARPCALCALLNRPRILASCSFSILHMPVSVS